MSPLATVLSHPLNCHFWLVPKMKSICQFGHCISLFMFPSISLWMTCHSHEGEWTFQYNCIMIIGWPIFRLERYFLGRKRNFLLHFARKSLHHHSIILVISDKHTHTGLMCRNTNHSRVTQTCRLSPLCYVHFSSIALVFVFSIVQNWTELVVIIPYLRGPSPFKKMEREWENEEEMEREWGSGEKFTL